MQVRFHEVGVDVDVVVAGFAGRFLQIDQHDDVLVVEEPFCLLTA